MMEVILKREVPRLGDRGDVVRVADGYARNYLFPQQMAIPATPASKKNIKEMKASADREAAQLKGDAQKLGQLLESLTIKIVARAGESDQLFGSVTSRDIVTELDKQGYKIDRHKIFLDKPIRLVGDHKVIIHLHRDIDVDLTVKVRAEGRENEEMVPKPQTVEAEPEASEEVAAPDAEAAETEEVSAANGKSRSKSSKRGEGKKAAPKKDQDEDEDEE